MYVLYFEFKLDSIALPGNHTQDTVEGHVSLKEFALCNQEFFVTGFFSKSVKNRRVINMEMAGDSPHSGKILFCKI